MRTINMASLCDGHVSMGSLLILGAIARTTLGRNIMRVVKPSNLGILSTKSIRWLA